MSAVIHRQVSMVFLVVGELFDYILPWYVLRLDDGLEMSLVRAQTEYEKLAGTIEVHVEEFTGYGKDVLKASRIYPEAFFQVVLQVAHMRMHGKPAAASCTISTRAFYRGRTEICRSCSREVSGSPITKDSELLSLNQLFSVSRRVTRN